MRLSGMLTVGATMLALSVSVGCGDDDDDDDVQPTVAQRIVKSPSHFNYRLAFEDGTVDLQFDQFLATGDYIMRQVRVVPGTGETAGEIDCYMQGTWTATDIAGVAPQKRQLITITFLDDVCFGGSQNNVSVPLAFEEVPANSRQYMTWVPDPVNGFPADVDIASVVDFLDNGVGQVSHLACANPDVAISTPNAAGTLTGLPAFNGYCSTDIYKDQCLGANPAAPNADPGTCVFN